MPDDVGDRIEEARRAIDAVALVYPELARELSNLRVRMLAKLDEVGLDVEAFERAAYVFGLALEAAFRHKGPAATTIARHPQDDNGLRLRRVVAWAFGIDPSRKP